MKELKLAINDLKKASLTIIYQLITFQVFKKKVRHLFM